MVDTGGMRIGQLAELAGTTRRTVRHYHRIGLLAEPERLANGYRDYGMTDAVRLMRIRWLADNGVPLGTIASLLSESPASGETQIAEDLQALIASIDEQQTILARRRERLAGLLDDAEHGRALSPLPARLADLLDQATTTATPAARTALRHERELVEALVLSGKAPDAFIDGFIAVLADPDRRDRYLDLLARWAVLGHHDANEAGEEITAVAEGFADLMGPLYDITSHADTTSHGEGHAYGMPPLNEVIDDPAQQAVVERLAGRLRADDADQGDGT